MIYGGLSIRSQTLFLSNSFNSFCMAMIHYGSCIASLTSFGSTRETKAENNAYKFLREDRVCVPLFGSLMMFYRGCSNDILSLLRSMDGV